MEKKVLEEGKKRLKEARERSEINFSTLSEDDLVEQIALLMKECSDQLGVEPQDLTWNEFRKFTEYYWGRSRYEQLTPNLITKVGGFNRIRDAFFPPRATSYAVRREEIAERAKINRSISLAAARDSLFFAQLEEVARRVFTNTIKPSTYATKKHSLKGVDRHLNLVLSDLHFGALLDNREVPLKYGPVESARRLAAVMKQACEYKLQYRKDTILNIFLLGDIIQNMLHDLRDGAPLAEQTCEAIYLLTQAISFASQHFKRVKVYCTTGNHGRLKSRHPQRATNQKWDSIETIIYYAVKTACSPLRNVEFEIPRTPFVKWESFGMKGFATHGDNTFNPGFPGKKVNVSFIEEQMNRINAALPDTEEYKVFVTGHVHTPCIVKVSNGARLITNGALIPSDEYALSIGYHESPCAQIMWETVPGKMVGDTRIIDLDETIDKDASLDKIIKPFEDF